MQDMFQTSLVEKYIKGARFEDLKATEKLHTVILSDIESKKGGRGWLAVEALKQQLERQPNRPFVTVTSAGRWAEAVQADLVL